MIHSVMRHGCIIKTSPTVSQQLNQEDLPQRHRASPHFQIFQLTIALPHARTPPYCHQSAKRDKLEKNLQDINETGFALRIQHDGYFAFYSDG
jgi:hypothetical protein